MSDLVERFVKLPGRGTTFVREVTGPPHAPVVMLLHGLAATALINWGPSLLPLGRGFRVVAPDHRGHGRGISSRTPFRLEDCADDADALADALGIERLIAVGYSMGGAVAQLLWKRHPSRIAGLVLCATAQRFGGDRQRRTASALAPLLTLAARAAPDSMWRQAARSWLDSSVADAALRSRIEAELAGTRPAAVVEAAAALAGFDSSRWIGDVGAPAATVVTTLDHYVAPQRQLDLAAAIAGTPVYRVASDHNVCMARPDLFVPALFAACRSVVLRIA